MSIETRQKTKGGVVVGVGRIGHLRIYYIKENAHTQE